MANFTAGTSFTDGVTNDVTALKLRDLVQDAVPTSNLALTSTTGTIATFNSTTPTFLGAITASTNTINVGSGQIYKDASGKVGIGTTSPARLLTIESATNPEIGLYNSGTERVKFSTGGSAGSQLAIDIGGAEAMRIDSSRNVGIGGTPSALLHIQATSPSLRIQAASGNSSAIDFYRTASVNSGQIACESTNSLVFSTNTGSALVERLRIDTSGNVGIGTTSADSILHIKGGVAVLTIEGTATSSASVQFKTNTLNRYKIATPDSSADLAFYSSGTTERLRITSGGEVYIAGTTDQGAYNLQVNGTGVWGAGAYVNGSDSRIKEDIQPLASGLDVVEKLNPVTYKYKETWSSDQSIQSGFIAQELLTALDGQIYIDGVVQHGGTEGYYSVAYQNLIPVLAKAIQELKSENDSLKSRIGALEAA